MAFHNTCTCIIHTCILHASWALTNVFTTVFREMVGMVMLGMVDMVHTGQTDVKR